MKVEERTYTINLGVPVHVAAYNYQRQFTERLVPQLMSVTAAAVSQHTLAASIHKNRLVYGLTGPLSSIAQYFGSLQHTLFQTIIIDKQSGMLMAENKNEPNTLWDLTETVQVKHNEQGKSIVSIQVNMGIECPDWIRALVMPRLWNQYESYIRGAFVNHMSLPMPQQRP